MAKDPADRVIYLTKATDITVRPVRWHWHERLALGSLALLGGREGVGKSICVAQLAADTTRGRLPGANFGRPRGVIVAATEDSWEHTIKPRLMAADADLDRVFRADVLKGAGVTTSVVLPTDLDELKLAIRVADAALVIFDPLLPRLAAELDTHKDSEVRQALEPLVVLADATSTCFLGLIHVNKGTSGDALTMLMGSRAFAAVARCVLFLMADPSDGSRRLLGTVKNNLGRTDLPTLAFRVTSVRVAVTAEGAVWTGKLDWLTEANTTIAEAIEMARAATGHRTATSEAGKWLVDYLTDSGGAADSATIKDDGKKAGYSIDSLKRAQGKLGIVTKNLPGFPRRTLWALSGSNVGSLHPTAPTAPTAPTEQGRHSNNTHPEYQSAQSEQSEHSPNSPLQLDAGAHAQGPASDSDVHAATLELHLPEKTDEELF